MSNMKRSPWGKMTFQQKGMVIYSLWLLVLALPLFAQAPMETNAKSTPSPKEEALNKMRMVSDDPSAYVEALINFVNGYPDSFEADSTGYMFGKAVQKVGGDPQKVRAMVDRFVTGIEPLPAALRARLYSSAVQNLLNSHLAVEATELAKKGIRLLDEKQYIDLERQRNVRDNDRMKIIAPKQKMREFSEEQAKNRYVLFQAGYYNMLGRGYLTLNDLDKAKETFEKAHGIKPGTESAWGLGQVAERRGQDAEALKYMTDAALTGKLKPKEISEFHDLYKKLHQGKSEDIEEYLDDQFRKTYHNPVVGEKYQPTAKRTNRTVLAEFFTGGGCVPCIPFDYSFERALEDYSRKELVLLVYHWHAPYLDPLCNHSNDARVLYYGINSAPTVLIDGKKYVGQADANNPEEARSVALQVFRGLVSSIDPRLENPARGHLELQANRVGEMVKVTASAEGFKNTSSDVTLHLVLVENEATYSGENGLRFQPMVVRNMARGKGAPSYGFKMDISKPNSIDYVFDLKEIMAENLRYYDEYPVERKKELSKRLDKATIDSLNFVFREKKNVINPNNISVVAFLQDNQTKEILQSVYIRVPSRRNADASE